MRKLSYIHTYKYDEAVRDGVVLDLRYEARDIDQNITSQAKVDQWFEVNTEGLSDLGKAQLKEHWRSLRKVPSCKDRLEKIVADIWLDMKKRDRLKSGNGNALLISGSIYSACRFFEMFHFLERHHNDRFIDLMDRIMPQWQLYREELNRTPLACEEWKY